MPVLHDFICSRCGEIVPDELHRPGQLLHLECGGVLEIFWNSRISRPANLPERESVALYYSPKENKLQYPGRNDLPVPERLRRRGYSKIWLRSDWEVGRFEKQHQVINERRHFDRNGKSFEDQ